MGSRLTPIETAIYAAAYVDAFRSIHEQLSAPDRVRRSEEEAEYVLAMYRRHRIAEDEAAVLHRAQRVAR